MIGRIGTLLLFAFLAAGPAAAETLDLASCLQLVRAQNPTLKAAALSPEIAATAVDAARSAYRPRIELNAGYTQQQAAQQVEIGGRSAPTQDQGYAHLKLGLDQLLFDFGRTSAGVGAAAAGQKSAGYALASAEQDLLLQAVAAYYRVLSSQAVLTAAQDEVTQTEAHRKTAQALYAEGVVTRNDVLQAEVRLASSRQQLLAAEGNEENAWLQLNYLTGRSPAARGELVARSEEADLSVRQPADDRPDLKAQRERISGAQLQLQRAKGAYRPELFGHLGADYVENSHVKEQTIYSATLGLRFTLYDGAARSARLSEAERNLRQKQLQLTDLRQLAGLEERTARTDAQTAARRIDVARTAITQAEENLRLNQERYREQVGTATDVLDAQTLLTRTRTDLARAQFDYQVALARISHAAGRL